MREQKLSTKVCVLFESTQSTVLPLGVKKQIAQLGAIQESSVSYDETEHVEVKVISRVY